MSDFSNAKGVITTPLKAIRKMCMDCVGGEWKRVTTCNHYQCTLVPLRMGKEVKGVKALKCIRAYCLWCMGYTQNESASTKRVRTKYVKECAEHDCWLWHFRFGKDPKKANLKHAQK